jgi:hypothetical protein
MTLGVPWVSCHKHPLLYCLFHWQVLVSKSVHVKPFPRMTRSCAFPSAIQRANSFFDNNQSSDYSADVVAPMLLPTPLQPELETFVPLSMEGSLGHLPPLPSSPDPGDFRGRQAEPSYGYRHPSDVSAADQLSPLSWLPDPFGAYSMKSGDRPPHVLILENDPTGWEISQQPRSTSTCNEEQAMATRDTRMSPEDFNLWMDSQLAD